MSRAPWLSTEQIAILSHAWRSGTNVKTAAGAAKCNVSTAYSYYAKFEADGSDATAGVHHIPMKMRRPVPMPEKRPAFPDVAHKLMRGRV